MSNHWDTIEDALKIARNHFETLEIYGYPEKVQAVDAAIAFVREMRQQPTVPEDVRKAIRLVIDEMGSSTDRAEYYSELRLIERWLDSTGAE